MASVNPSSKSFSYLSSTGNKFTGLVSGMDTESMVEKLMKAQSAQMEKLQQQRQKVQWQRDAYRDVNTKLSTFEKNIFDKYGLQSSLSAKSVSVSDSTKLSVTAGPSASGTLSIQDVESLATSATGISKELKVGNSNATAATKLSELGLSGKGTVTLNVLQADGKMKEKEVAYDSEEDTIESFTNRLNNSGAGVTALFSNGQMSITSNATGNVSGGAIQVNSDSNGANGVFQKLGFLSNEKGEIANGGNAKYTVNGLKMESASNTFTISGYSVTIKEKFDAKTPVTVSSTTDVDGMVDKLKEFVKTYNDLITSLNDKATEKKYAAYPPLTDAEKAGMSEDQIKKWEEKAMSGLLRSDSIVRSVVSDIRGVAYNSTAGIDEKYNSLFKIGITTTKSYNDGGKLEIDEKKLREALTSDPDSVIKLFTQKNTGVVEQMRDAAKKAIGTIEKKAGKESAVDNQYSIGKQLVSLDSKIEDWKGRLKKIEERYWKQFSAMENAIQKANSQSSYFASNM